MVVILIVSPPPGASSDSSQSQTYIYNNNVAPAYAYHPRYDSQGHSQATSSSNNGISSSTSPSLLSSLSSQVDPDNVLATNKEGEYEFITGSCVVYRVVRAM